LLDDIDKLKFIELMEKIEINFNCLVDAQLDFYAKLKVGLTTQELIELKKEIFDKYKLKNKKQKNIDELDRC
jgi:hypothetical protein